MLLLIVLILFSVVFIGFFSFVLCSKLCLSMFIVVWVCKMWVSWLESKCDIFFVNNLFFISSGSSFFSLFILVLIVCRNFCLCFLFIFFQVLCRNCFSNCCLILNVDIFLLVFSFNCFEILSKMV